MTRPQFTFLATLILAVLTTTTEGASGFFGLVTGAFFLYWLWLEGSALYRRYKDETTPPYGLDMRMSFNTQEERSEFTDAVNELLISKRREEDPTNGLTEEQLAATQSKKIKERPKTLEARQDVVTRYEEKNQTPREIASDLNVSVGTVYDHLRKAGVTFSKGRPRHAA